MVFYQICVFGADLKFNMAARVHNVFSLAEILKNLLVRNHQANWIVTLQEWSLGGPVLKLWIVCRSEIQDGHHDIGPYGNFIFSSFFLKPQNRFEPNLTEMFIGWSYTRLVFLVLIGNPIWLPGPVMCSDWSKFKKIFLLETTKPIELWLCRNDHWVVLY